MMRANADGYSIENNTQVKIELPTETQANAADQAVLENDKKISEFMTYTNSITTCEGNATSNKMQKGHKKS